MTGAAAAAAAQRAASDRHFMAVVSADGLDHFLPGSGPLPAAPDAAGCRLGAHR